MITTQAAEAISVGLSTGVILFIEALGASIAVGILTLYLDRRYRERDEAREARYTQLLRDAQAKADAAILTAQRSTDESDAKTRARIDFLMSLINGSGAGNHAAGADDTSADYQVLEILMSTYDEEELKALAFEIGIRWESLAGEKPVTRALSLTQAARNTGKMRALVNVIRRDRPEAMHA